MPQLDPTNTEPAYLCGRLMATIQGLQYRALGYKINRTVTDTYYATAAHRPSAAMPALLVHARNLLTTLRRQHVGAALYWEGEVRNIMDQMEASTGFPTVLPAAEQGLFHLGFYQEQAEVRRKREAERLKREMEKLKKEQQAAQPGQASTDIPPGEDEDEDPNAIYEAMDE